MWIFNRICYYLLKRIGYLNKFSFIYFRKIILFSSILTWWPGVALWSANALRIGSYESLKESVQKNDSLANRTCLVVRCMSEKQQPEPVGPVRAVKTQCKRCLSHSPHEMKRTRALYATEECAVYKVWFYIKWLSNDALSHIYWRRQHWLAFWQLYT